MELLNDMALFVEVVKAKGFRGASEATGVPNSTLSRRIGALEKAIGLRLLHRTTRKVELTEAGQIYFERCKRIVDEARLAHEQLGDLLAQPSGVLRASLPVDFTVIYLAPLIAEFAERYPGISFEFDLTPRQVDLISEPFDVAIRMGEPSNSNLIARPLVSLVPRLYAAPRYLKRMGEPEKPADLKRHECLNVQKGGIWTLRKNAQSVQLSIGSRFTINNVGLIRRMATLGMGIMLMPEEVVAEDVAAKRLVRVLPDWHGKPMPVYALTETRLLPAKTQRFIEFLKERLAQA
ncbi:LysR family transcriptional regulator [Dyella mobilis]|uniref:LysR family transcriptional regulator n=1 Tax=Dyella mobilis TaxID=1849582 RepID=A0ABS2KIP8_9GAMM|nr:LysR family transcriptional regulator [Dyella mobilis]MBM7130632.1 LysR family transcriptional regulator [Dyella mobilis]GLQ97259.1 transcriptional regulator [Dyella mobilis]